MCELGLYSLPRRPRPGVFRKQTNQIYILLFLVQFLTGLQESFDYCFGHYAVYHLLLYQACVQIIIVFVLTFCGLGYLIHGRVHGRYQSSWNSLINALANTRSTTPRLYLSLLLESCIQLLYCNIDFAFDFSWNDMMPSKFLFMSINAIQIQLLNYRYFEQQDRQSIVPMMSLGDIIVKFILYSIFIFGYYIGYYTAISTHRLLLLLLTSRSTPTRYFCCWFLFLKKKSKLKVDSFFR